MQPRARRSNDERSATTRQALVSASRALFVEKGYAQTSTPEVVAAAAVTRGALYHHFEDKQALLRAVLEREFAELRRAIDQATPPALDAREALIAGSLAYLDAMAVPGRTRLLLVDGPAVFGHAEMMALDEASAAGSLREGLAALLGDGPLVPALASLLSAAFDRAALAISTGGDAKAYRAAMLALIERVTAGVGR
ncbi:MULTISPECIES: TetR/AcrR family transcriptional regulator [Myxococcus]|uniref:TetR/AcrR family transcriptional regulator n=1 Tax=Myxococcus TaxID=32 RepID=UPI00112E3DBF|nr:MULTISPECIES: TetR family transcriptional regulator [Myxococcus]NOK03864.1 TetR family transcriptional regulator [Myxococcus xanthus]QDE85777.1 TetR family transcriptional regulator [Myxococcus xanthus]QDF07694.1 TetR family transcriptional regulator [Myxococcus xanthus]